MKRLMNKIKNIFNRIPNIYKVIKVLFRKRSISSQLIITIILIFSSFFILQSLLNSRFFKNFYTEKEFNDIHTDLISYVNAMNNPNNDYYDEMYEFTSQRNAYSVIVSGDFRILISSYTDYTVIIEDILTAQTYTVSIPNNDYPYALDEVLELSMSPNNETEDLYSPSSIYASSRIIYTSDSPCDEEE